MKSTGDYEHSCIGQSIKQFWCASEAPRLEVAHKAALEFKQECVEHSWNEAQVPWSDEKPREEINYSVLCGKVATGLLFMRKPKQFYFIYVQTIQFAVKIE